MHVKQDLKITAIIWSKIFSHLFQDLNLDLVQFPRAVIIHEVRVVPLGTRVNVDVPGGVRLGSVLGSLIACNSSSAFLAF